MRIICLVLLTGLYSSELHAQIPVGNEPAIEYASQRRAARGLAVQLVRRLENEASVVIDVKQDGLRIAATELTLALQEDGIRVVPVSTANEDGLTYVELSQNVVGSKLALKISMEDQTIVGIHCGKDWIDGDFRDCNGFQRTVVSEWHSSQLAARNQAWSRLTAEWNSLLRQHDIEPRIVAIGSRGFLPTEFGKAFDTWTESKPTLYGRVYQESATLSLPKSMLDPLIQRELKERDERIQSLLRNKLCRIVLCVAALALAVWVDRKTNAYHRPVVAIGLTVCMCLLLL